jgi:hypothetical protein
MSKFDDALVTYTEAMKNTLKIKDIDASLLKAVTKGLGPSIYKADASKVSCSDKEELARVKNNFLIKKLGLDDSPALDKAIQEVCEEFGSRNPNKYRAVFYYLLTKKLGKESFYL